MDWMAKTLEGLGFCCDVVEATVEASEGRAAQVGAIVANIQPQFSLISPASNPFSKEQREPVLS